jgi:hypothetical protein
LCAPPQLRVLNAPHLSVPAHEAPFGALRVRELTCSLVGFDAHTVFSLAIAAHASLTGLTLLHTRLDAPGALDALVDAALAARLSALHLRECLLPRTAAEALARLLRSSAALTALSVVLPDTNGFMLLLSLPQPAAAQLAATLRANATLTSLSLCFIRLWAAARTPPRRCCARSPRKPASRSCAWTASTTSQRLCCSAA